MTKIRFILKNGAEIAVMCADCEVTRNNLIGELVSYRLTGIEGKYPLYIKTSEIVAIVDERKVATRG